MDNSQSIQQQLDKEFNRIWNLIQPILRNDKKLRHSLPDNLGLGFAAENKDPKLGIFWGEYSYNYWDESGEEAELIVENSHLINGIFFEDIDFLDIKQIILKTIFLIKDDQGEYILKEGQNTARIEYIGDHNVAVSTETFRTIFKQNCFAETQEEIDNLKLITW